MAKKKAGQNKVSCTSYKNKNQRERNKIKKIERHLKRVQPGDTCALAALERAKKAVKGY